MTGDLVDLRSDTVTRPTPAMRTAMAEAEVGDDMYGEDPTVRRLEEAYAERVGKQAALFVPSGVMANQLALRVLGRPGTVLVAPARAHVVVYEAAAAASAAGLQVHALDDDGGLVDPGDVRWAIEAVADHHPRVGLVSLENTHMPANGAPLPPDHVEAVAAEARAGGVALHLDGARLFHAEIALGIPAATLAAPATTVMSCMSKGLCAPVGSVLAGPADVIAAARHERHRAGGAMRQSGVVAAAALVGLTQMVERLAEDHRRARVLAEAVAERWPASGLDPATVRTNVVTWRHDDPRAVIEALHAEGVLVGTIAPRVLRAVAHHDVDDAGVERAREALAVAP